MTIQYLENIQRAALAQVTIACQNEVFGASLTAHLSSLGEGLSRAQEEVSASLADLANTHPQDVSENQVYEVCSKGTALVPIEFNHMHPVLTTISDGEAQTLANMVIARRMAYLDRSGLRSRIHCALMALPIESYKLFARKIQEARLWNAEENEVDKRKAFLKSSSSGYHKQQTSAKGKALLRGSRLLRLSRRNPSHPLSDCHHPQGRVVGSQESWAPYSTNSLETRGTSTSTRKCPSPGLPSDLGQVGTRPDSKVCLPRRGLRSSNWAGQAF